MIDAGFAHFEYDLIWVKVAIYIVVSYLGSYLC